MEKFIFFSTIALLFFATLGCDNKEDENKYPNCMQEQIDEFINNTNSKIGAIKKYKYKDEIVYIFWRFVANEKIEVLDAHCNVIESIITGGVAGCNPKLKEFKYIETVWEYNKRKEK